MLADSDGPVSTAVLETHLDLRRSRLEGMLKVLDVDGAVRRVKGGWQSTGQPWSYDAARYQRVALTRATEQQAMLDYESTSGCRLQFLRRCLDDHDAQPCGRCDRCGGFQPSAEVPADHAELVDQELHRAGTDIEPRRLWPTAMPGLGVDLRGRIPAAEQALPGRAVGRLSGLGWGNDLRALFAANPAPAEVPLAMRRALGEVIASWGLAAGERPELIVGIRSLRRAGLLGHLVTGLAAYTGLPVAAWFDLVGDARPDEGVVNSAQRLAIVWRRYQLSDPSAVAGARVLLVDDQVVSGWTMTVTARALLLAGASGVLPLALAVP